MAERTSPHIHGTESLDVALRRGIAFLAASHGERMGNLRCGNSNALLSLLSRDLGRLDIQELK